MTSFYVYVMLFSSIFCRLIDSQLINTTSILNNIETTTRGNETNQTFLSTTTVIVSTTVNSIATPTVFLNTTAIDEITTSVIESNPPSKSSFKSHWWLIVILIVTVVVAISIGIIHYYRRHTPYRRFLQNWRPRYDDRDNIILQLEQPEMVTGQWPPRISFA